MDSKDLEGGKIRYVCRAHLMHGCVKSEAESTSRG